MTPSLAVSLAYRPTCTERICDDAAEHRCDWLRDRISVNAGGFAIDGLACVVITLDDDLTLIDDTGRLVRSGRRSAIAPHLAPIWERLHLNVAALDCFAVVPSAPGPPASARPCDEARKWCMSVESQELRMEIPLIGQR